MSPACWDAFHVLLRDFPMVGFQCRITLSGHGPRGTGDVVPTNGIPHLRVPSHSLVGTRNLRATHGDLSVMLVTRLPAQWPFSARHWVFCGRTSRLDLPFRNDSGSHLGSASWVRINPDLCDSVTTAPLAPMMCSGTVNSALASFPKLSQDCLRHILRFFPVTVLLQNFASRICSSSVSTALSFPCAISEPGLGSCNPAKDSEEPEPVGLGLTARQ